MTATTSPIDRALHSALALVAALFLSTANDATAQQPQSGERRALVIPGKQSLQQRVISRPGATLNRQPQDAPAGEALLPFSVFYVYGRRPESGNAEWLEVGRSSRGQPDGWIKADQAIEWRHNMTVAFNNPAGRDRVLFFRERTDVLGAMGSDAAARVAEMRAQAAAGRMAANSPVMAIEPEVHIDIARRFYLLPILQAERATLQSGFSASLLEIASIPLPQPQANAPQPTPAAREQALREFNVGVAFVIDTSLSMDPYIERVRESIRAVIERIRGDQQIGQRFRFALVGFRNSTRAAPQLEYVSRVFATFEDFRDPQRFMGLIQQMRATNVDSGSFDEDAIAGLRTAIDDLKWDDYGGRYMVLITDAGTRRANDPASTTRLGPAQIRQLAQSRGIATYVLHLLTPAGGRLNNHDPARAQYEELSQWPNVGALYYSVPEGSLADFGARVDELMGHLTQQVAGSGAGVRPGQGQRPQQPAPQQAQPQAPNQTAQRLTEQTLLVGQAMRLAYLGRREQAEAPPMFRAWTADRDLRNPDIATLDVRVLVSRNQLSDLRDVLQVVLEQGQQNRLTPRNFFDSLRSAVANMARNPAALRARDAQNLGDLLGEFLSDLPYRSQIMEITPDQWLAMGPGAQREVLDAIEARLRLYQELEGRRDLWVSFDGGRVPGDAVYPMSLDALP